LLLGQITAEQTSHFQNSDSEYILHHLACICYDNMQLLLSD